MGGKTFTRHARSARLSRSLSNTTSSCEKGKECISKVYNEAMCRAKDKLYISRTQPIKLQHLFRFLIEFVAELYLNCYEPVSSSPKRFNPESSIYTKTPFNALLDFHDKLINLSSDLVNGVGHDVMLKLFDRSFSMGTSGEHRPDLAMQAKMDRWFGEMAGIMYNKWIKQDFYTNEKRTNQDIVSMMNTCNDTTSYLLARSFSFSLEFLKQTTEFAIFTNELSTYLVQLDNMKTNVGDLLIAFDQAERRLAMNPGAEGHVVWHVNPPGVNSNKCNSASPERASPERKSTLEWERNKELCKQREEREEAERIAEQREKSAKITAHRKEAARKMERANQERCDALEACSKNTNQKQCEPSEPHEPDPVEVIKAAEKMSKAREAKKMDIELARERIRQQKEKQKIKDEVEANEQDKRAHALETAKRIAHGEGYSKRKGNKE